jgi:hypothetical protein
MPETHGLAALRQIKTRIGDLQKLRDQATGDGRKWALGDVWNIAHNAILQIERDRPAAAEPDIEDRITRLTDALKSISANTCCDNCREAALVARSALASYVGLAREPDTISDKALGGLIAEICSHAAVKEVMEVSWDDICTDTGCHPLDIAHGKNKHLIFRAGHWADQIAKRLFLKALTKAGALRIKAVQQSADRLAASGYLASPIASGLEEALKSASEASPLSNGTQP